MYGSILEESDTLMSIGVRSLKTCIARARKPPGMRGSACVEVMTTLHGSAPSLRRRAEVAYRRRGSICSPSLGSVPWVEWERGIDQFELEDGYSADYTDLHATSHDQAAVIPPIVTPVTIIEDPRSHSYEGLGLDEAQLLTLFPLSLSGMTQRWYASLESSRRRTWEDLAQEFLRQYSFSGDTSVTRRELEFLRQGSDESLVQALFDVDDGISRGLWSDIIPSPILRGRELVDHLRAMETYVLRIFSIDDLVIIPMRDHCRYPGVISHLTASSSSFSSAVPSVHPHTVTVRPSFQFQRPQTSIPRHEQSRPHRRRQRTYSDLGCLWIELLSDSELLVLVPLAPRPPRVPYLRVFVLMSSVHHQMAGHRTDYCASLRHTIQDLIDSGAVSLPISTTDTDLGPDMTADSFPVYSTHAVPPPSGLYHHVLDTQGTDIHRTL
ncbi:hypothetical protein CK203_082770 [Vitis vinifera]|uniref:Retrotransposon gag domain-containing protein n=1 Tax=Vitis vinifera TaxID=29760 RepID=A0A438DXP0_VITVI|nr:hypothetical protein CK203_082770 [Vitis vinifera]